MSASPAANRACPVLALPARSQQRRRSRTSGQGTCPAAMSIEQRKLVISARLSASQSWSRASLLISRRSRRFYRCLLFRRIFVGRNFRHDRLLLCVRPWWGDFRLISCRLLAHFGDPMRKPHSGAGLLGFPEDLPIECYLPSLRAASFTSPTALWTSPLALSSLPSD